MDELTTKETLKYFKQKNQGVFELLNNYFRLMEAHRSEKHVEISSESKNGKGIKTFRITLSCMRYSEITHLLAPYGLQNEAKKFLIRNFTDRCFTLGIAEYQTHLSDARLKIYNEYSLCTKNINIKENIKKIAHFSRIAFLTIKKDIDRFKIIKAASVDIYKNIDDYAVKVNYGPFLTKNIFSLYKGLFRKKSLKKYLSFYNKGLLPKLFLFSIRYMRKETSIRTDFWYNTYVDIDKYSKYLDGTELALQLYNDLKRFSKPRLTFICMDLDKRPRTQSYFYLNSRFSNDPIIDLPEGYAAGREIRQ